MCNCKTLSTLKLLQCTLSKHFKKRFYSFLYENVKHITKFLKLKKKQITEKKSKNVEISIYRSTKIFDFAKRKKKINKPNIKGILH